MVSKDIKDIKITPEIISKIFEILANPVAAEIISKILNNEAIVQQEKDLLLKISMDNDDKNLTLNYDNYKSEVYLVSVRRTTHKKKYKDKVYTHDMFTIILPSRLVKSLGLKDGDRLRLHLLK